MIVTDTDTDTNIGTWTGTELYERVSERDLHSYLPVLRQGWGAIAGIDEEGGMELNRVGGCMVL